ncbi:hypothetical protein HWV62_38170 [Athelia sp. TMB]|nr:hypothetical protein HWV62_38170 [Athelia sp. TMB]
MTAYPRLIAYLSINLMKCSPTEKAYALIDTSAYVLSDSISRTFNDHLQEWTTWDDIRVISGQRQIKEDLQRYFEVLNKASVLGVAVSPSLIKAQTESLVPTTDMFQDLLALDVMDLSAQLAILLMDNDRYGTFVACHPDEAQPLLDFLQARLDYPIASKFKSRHLRALVKLSERSRRYPECLILETVTLPAEPICFGSFGDVYKCKIAGRDVAVKVMRVYQKSDANNLLKRFTREAVLWRQLSHQNVLPFYGAFRLGAEQRKLCMALDVAEGLAYLHSLKIVHADLKSMNILISHAPRACLADFGLSLAKGTGSIRSTMRSTGSFGTVRWMAPEFFSSPDDSDSEANETRRPDQLSDVYSFAMVCYEIFSERIPFEGKNDLQVIRAVSIGKRPERPANAHSRGLTDDVWGIMDDCWAQLPEKRLSAGQAVGRMRGLPELPVDDRLLDQDDMPSLSRTIYKQSHHPFAILESRDVPASTDDIKSIAGDLQAVTVDMQRRDWPDWDDEQPEVEPSI